MTEITARKPMDGDLEDRTATVVVDLGENLQDAVAKFGEDVVFTNFQQSTRITAQGAMRRMLDKGKTQEEITARMADWKPGVALSRDTDPVSAMKAKLASMDPQAAKELLAQLKASVA